MMRYKRLACAACALALMLANAPALSEDAAVLPQIGAEAALDKEAVREYQKALISLGYLNGRADGLFGPKTAAAVRAFQEDSGLEPTGALDGDTARALREQAQATASVKAAQQKLIDLGYLRGKADGVFGERSRAATRLFQALNGLEATDRIDDATMAKLDSGDVAALPAQLSGGDKGERVTALQEKLIQFGFLGDIADGSYGKHTAAAVGRFQDHLIAQGVDERLGIEPTGEATPATQVLLFDPDYSSYLTDVAPGDEGSEVLRAERRLNALGYMDLEADEIFDDYAASAARAFAEAAGLPAGTLDKTAIDALYAADAPRAAHYVPHDIAAGDRGEAVREVENLLICAGMTTKMPNGRYDDDLREAVGRLGSYLSEAGAPSAGLFADDGALSIAAQETLRTMALEGAWDIDAESDPSQIERLQRRLHTLYYLSRGNQTGKFGEKTEKALRAFQRANGLEETGVADGATRRVLFSADAVENRRPYRVEVDISRQRVYVYALNDDGEYEQTHEFVCSTGVGDSTPRGIFLDAFPANYWHHFEKFDCWAKYSFEVEGNIMIHSVIFDEDDDSTVRMNSVYALGSKASHGCIRLKVADARWLFEHCRRGSLVLLIY